MGILLYAAAFPDGTVRDGEVCMKKMQNADEADYLNCIDDLLSSSCVREMQEYIQHGSISTYSHCMAVAYYSYRLCLILRLHVDLRSVARGAMLHDLYLYDWHVPDAYHRLHGFRHADSALANARKYFEINPVEADIIEKHMWPLTLTRIPRRRESAVVCMVDKACSLSETFGYRYHDKFSASEKPPYR